MVGFVWFDHLSFYLLAYQNTLPPPPQLQTVFCSEDAAMDNQSIDLITKVLEQSAKLVEEEVDAKLSKLNEMDEDDFERLREKRLDALKKAQKQKQV